MIKIHAKMRYTREQPFAPEQYTLDTHSTMGRLIKSLLDKGHYGREVFQEVDYFHPQVLDNKRLDELIYQQVRELKREGREPLKILVGAQMFDDFQREAFHTPGYWTCKITQHVIDPSSPQGWRYDTRIMGLPITIIPEMEGVLVLDSFLLEVPALPPGL